MVIAARIKSPMKPLRQYLLLPAIAVVLYVGLPSCRKSAPRNVSTVDTVITDATIFIDITLDGTRTLGIYDSTQKPPLWGNVFGTIDPDSTLFIYDRVGATFVRNGPSSFPQFSFSMGNLQLFPHIAAQPSATLLATNVADSFFSATNISYSHYSGDTSFTQVGDSAIVFARTLTRKLASPGVNISWVDSSGTVWETLYAPAEQTGSYFTITAFQLRNSVISGYANLVTLTASFGCTLYDGKGHSIQLTQGRLRQAMSL